MVDDTSKGQGAPQPKDPEPKPRLFTRDFLFATLINLLITTTFFTLVTGMAVYAAAEFSAGETAAGFAASAFVVGALGARVFAYKYVNTLGRKRVMITCLAVFTLATVAYLGVDSYELLITVRIVHGIALGFAQTALTASVFDIIPKSRRGEGSGYYLLANALPPALGPCCPCSSPSGTGSTRCSGWSAHSPPWRSRWPSSCAFRRSDDQAPAGGPHCRYAPRTSSNRASSPWPWWPCCWV
ncbi:MFS transporter [Nesterenkonia pannonica]|uniref:MFS transporter n=1 Tax=Nesterenkonia pannonica TaxID=1548602 RepID=UPI0021645EB6|nr:MFS transporter [Nesterenkonia pannonica]